MAYLSEKSTMLSKKKIDEIEKYLQGIDVETVLDKVIQDVAGGYHLQYYPERSHLLERCKKSTQFSEIIHSMCCTYRSLFVANSKGTGKYINFQLQWMHFIRDLLHFPENQVKATEINELWQCICGDSSPSKDTRNSILTSIARAVFNTLQQQVVAFKESSGISDDGDMEDPVEEALVFTDRASLHRLGGFALFSAIKGTATSDVKLNYFLASLQLPQDQKDQLPINLQVLDKGKLTFMKEEMIGYLSEVGIIKQWYCKYMILFTHRSIRE